VVEGFEGNGVKVPAEEYIGKGKDNESPALTSNKRIVLKVAPQQANIYKTDK